MTFFSSFRIIRSRFLYIFKKSIHIYREKEIFYHFIVFEKSQEEFVNAKAQVFDHFNKYFGCSLHPLSELTLK